MGDRENYSRFLNPCLLHLQKMGLELKCPICLNLQRQPMLLPCNHIFCSPCISTSMNFGLDCPVCKLPFVCQDLRPAPHMENVVSIYKSMHTAFGASLFQSESRVDLSDMQRPSSQSPVSHNIDVGEKSRTEQMKRIHKESPKKMQSSNPDFPDNKRVQISHHGVKSDLETSERSVKSSKMKDDRERDGFVKLSRQNSVRGSSEEAFAHEGNPAMSPFSWLSDGQCVMNGTQERDVNQLAQTSSYSPPSYGDNQDSDDDNTDQGSEHRVKRLSTRGSRKNKPEDGTISKTDFLSPSSGIDPSISETKVSRKLDTMNRRPSQGTEDNSNSKRQKKLNYGIHDNITESIHNQLNNIDNENAAKDVSASNSESNIKPGGLLCSKQPSACNGLELNPSVVCAFCQTYIDSMASGPMLHYVNGKAVVADQANQSNVLHVHRKCMEWTPQVYFVGETIKNLELEVARGAKIKCNRCGRKGATLGCYSKSCRKSFHVPCAVNIPECKWDCDNFLMLCPAHASLKLPNENPKSKKIRANHSSELQPASSKSAGCLLSSTSQKANELSTNSPNEAGECVLCGSSLSAAEKDLLAEFARLTGATVTKCWNESVTHVVASTDEAGACSRTIKVLMAILSGKWVLKIDWLKACMESMRLVDEEPFEICLDIHGSYDGPKKGRMRIMEKEPKLFSGLNFHFSGDFVPSYKGCLEDLIIAAGGTVLLKREKLTSQDDSNTVEAPSSSFVIFSLDPPERCNSEQISSVLKNRLKEANAYAAETGSQVTGHTWILDSIVACRLQPLHVPSEDVLYG